MPVVSEAIDLSRVRKPAFFNAIEDLFLKGAVNETTCEIGRINEFDTSYFAVLINLAGTILKLIPTRDMGWENDKQGDRPKEFDEWVKELAEGLLELITALIVAVGDFLKSLAEAAVEAGLKFVQVIVAAVIWLIELILKEALLAFIYLIFALFIAGMTTLFAELLVGLALLTLVYGGLLSLDGFSLEYSRFDLKINILLEIFWVYSPHLDVDVPKSNFSMKFLYSLIVEIEFNLIDSSSKIRFLDSLALKSISNFIKGDQMYQQMKNLETELFSQDKMLEEGSQPLRGSSENNATLGYFVDIKGSDWDEDAIDYADEGRDDVEDHLDDDYSVSTYNNEEFTEENLLNSLENDDPDIFVLIAHGNDTGEIYTMTTEETLDKKIPDALTAEDIKSVNPVSEGKLVFLLVCSSLADDDLPEAFFSIGYEALIGFPETAEIYLGVFFMTQFFYYAIKEDYSVQDAFDKAELDSKNTQELEFRIIWHYLYIVAGFLFISWVKAAAEVTRNPKNAAVLIMLVLMLFTFINTLGLYDRIKEINEFNPELREADGVDANDIDL
ncbi:MAG: hypothetical protein ACTSPD_21555 [Promethearchaeota archaeon]